MALPSERLHEIVVELTGRPGHEKVRALVYELLVHGLGASSSEVLFERRVPEVHGRLDALLGRTVFEFKRDLRMERRDAEEELTRYLGEREMATGERFVGVATDGADFWPYELQQGRLVRLTPFQPNKDTPRTLVEWLDGAVLVQTELQPEPEIVARELGRGSLAFAVARSRLAELWREVAAQPAVRLQRQLWADLLAKVYGAPIDQDDLFFQHTYLTIVAKTMATRVLGVDLPEPAALLAGRPFQEMGIAGAVESDFFDWVLAAPGSADLIRRLSRQVSRFRLNDIEHDVLKVLYESLIDPEQRHELGEYYTPDWLAAKVCAHAIPDPLNQRVLDPACGSGTFLFHAVRQFLTAADAAALPNREALARCVDRVLGIDIHPVAAIIARVTYLLALGEDRLRDHPPLSLPVYLGDSMQWNTRDFLAQREVLIAVPEGPVLHFPWAVTSDPSRFDAVVERMLSLSEHQAPAAGLLSWLERERIGDASERTSLAQTYQHLCDLRAADRDHIWGYVARNLSRPIYLASSEQRADVVVGNPPWLSYRYMASDMQARFKLECQLRGIWAGGKLATHQDLSAYFFARCTELYLKETGTIAFVMPYAALNRGQFKGFRRGWFEGTGTFAGTVFATVRFTEAWSLDETVQPLFPVPACVLFARRSESGPLPKSVTAYSGQLPKRDATLAEAEGSLQAMQAPWPETSEFSGGSTYRKAFHQGATMVPRMLCTVEQVAAGRFGANPAAPNVQSRRALLEKPPWKNLPALRGTVEAQFLRPLYLGESIAPFRPLVPVLAVIPWDSQSDDLLDSDAAEQAGYRGLAGWMRDAEAVWEQHRRGTMSFIEQVDFYGKLSAQLPPAPLRVFYAASGTLPAASLVQHSQAVAEHKLYWAPVSDVQEARYLEAILNSEALRSRISGKQSKGQWGARDFDKVVFDVAIANFDRTKRLHQQLVAAAEHAAEVAAAVQLPEDVYFTTARRLIRTALQADGAAQRIEELVAVLLKDL